MLIPHLKLNFCWSLTASQMRPMANNTKPTMSMGVMLSKLKKQNIIYMIEYKQYKSKVYLGFKTNENGALTNMTGRLTVNTHTAWNVQKPRNLRGFDRLSSNLSSSPILIIL